MLTWYSEEMYLRFVSVNKQKLVRTFKFTVVEKIINRKMYKRLKQCLKDTVFVTMVLANGR